MINFGKWSYSSGKFFSMERIYLDGYIWSPFVKVKLKNRKSNLVTINADDFEHLLNCMCNQKYINEQSTEIQIDWQTTIDKAYHSARSLLSPKYISDEADSTRYKTPLETMRELTAIQGSTGNWNYDEYMHGMYNGMELMLAISENREPNYKNCPDKWLRDMATECFDSISSSETVTMEESIK